MFMKFVSDIIDVAGIGQLVSSIVLPTMPHWLLTWNHYVCVWCWYHAWDRTRSIIEPWTMPSKPSQESKNNMIGYFLCLQQITPSIGVPILPLLNRKNHHIPQKFGLVGLLTLYHALKYLLSFSLWAVSLGFFYHLSYDSW